MKKQKFIYQIRDRKTKKPVSKVYSGLQGLGMKLHYGDPRLRDKSKYEIVEMATVEIVSFSPEGNIKKNRDKLKKIKIILEEDDA